jgi:hypothetical protein
MRSKCVARLSTAAGIIATIATACGGATRNATARDAGSNAGDDATGSDINDNGSSGGGALVLPGSNGGGGSSGSVVGPADAGPLSGVNVATFDAGPVWACYQAHCATQLAKCSMEASCNNPVVASVQCVVLGGADNQCFTPAVGSVMDNAAISCILDVYTSMVCSPDGGASDASSRG